MLIKKSLPGFLLAFFAVGWRFLGIWARIEFLLGKFSLKEQTMNTITAIASSTWFPLALLIAGLTWIYLVNARLLGYWPFSYSYKRRSLQRLCEELEEIGKAERLNYQNLHFAIRDLRAWKDKARRLMFQLLGPEEAGIFNEKITLIEKRDEYHDPTIGGIKAFCNEKEFYQEYLTNLIDCLYIKRLAKEKSPPGA